ncbi:MAG TPA: hypothetical protein VK578_24380 [Edaphobacter sp.]|nr:hypothetical protein [Edaphobacter sp.]
MTGPDANTQDTHPAVTTYPLLEVGVLLGLMRVGLADIRGALYLGVDEGSWINSALNVSMMRRAAEVLGRSCPSRPIRWQSLTAFFFGHIFCGILVVVSSMSKVQTEYWQVTAASVEAK